MSPLSYHAVKLLPKRRTALDIYRKANPPFIIAAVREKRNIHAEENVVRQLGDCNRLRDADMYIIRYGRFQGQRCIIGKEKLIMKDLS